MEDFSITSRLTKNEYAKVVFLGLCRKPAFILIQLSAIYLLIYDESYILGTFFILSPVIITLIAVNQYKSSVSFRSDIKFTFGENGMRVEAPTYKSEFTWKHILKHKQISNFLILYHSNRMGNFIDTRKLNAEQLKFIKDKVVEK
ncbi:YcxB family protein [Flavobacterium sp.]